MDQAQRKTGGRHLLLAAIFIIALLVFLSLVFPKYQAPPRLPKDPDHRQAATESACLGCHYQGEKIVVKMPHEPRRNCWTCHGKVD